MARTCRAIAVAVDRAVRGREAEDRAVACLQAAGAEILIRNYRRRSGELDIVALLDGTVLVVEVRLRCSNRFGGSAASVDRHKQRRIVSATRQLLQQRRELARYPVRFDVIAIGGTPARANRALPGDGDMNAIATSDLELEWIRHAFEARG
jgi:putative endonuclease